MTEEQKEQDKTKVSLCLNSESAESMEDEAKERGVKLSELYQQAIDEFIGGKFDRDLAEQTLEAKTIPLDSKKE